MTHDNLPKGEETFTDGIFGTDAYEAQKPQKKDFLPWHKPRKQFVRHYQWCELISNLLEGFQPEDNTLKYLGLPGIDLLDLRYFHSQICEPKKLHLRFLGFNSAASPGSNANAELNISLDEVRRLPRIDARSDVIPDNFCRIADNDSIAWKRAKDFGPYDVVNLDLCDGFAAHEPGTTLNNHYESLNKIISLQARRKNPWLLLLTTRTGKQDINEQVFNILLNTYRRNLTNHQNFKECSKNRLNIDDDESLLAITATPDGHLSVFLVSLCKWMLGLSLRQTPPCKIEVNSTIGYRVDMRAEHDDLVSIALKFEPTFGAVHDPAGLSAVADPTPDEGKLAVKILGRVLSRKSADVILAEDKELHENMITATEKLLELARYDVSTYRDWLHASYLAL